MVVDTSGLGGVARAGMEITAAPARAATAATAAPAVRMRVRWRGIAPPLGFGSMAM